jgi:hypothetical protein
MKDCNLEIHGSLSSRAINGSTVLLDLLLIEADIPNACLRLMMLDYAILESLIITTKTGKLTLILRVSSELSRARLTVSSQRFSIRLSKNGLQALIAFLLQYCRDGYAPVNHIDIELERLTQGRRYALVVRVDKFAAPISSDEAKKLLGLE